MKHHYILYKIKKNLAFATTLLCLLAFIISAQAQSQQWVREFGGSGFCNVQHCVTDSQGNMYIAGQFGDTMDAAPGPNIHYLVNPVVQHDVFVARLDANGMLLWAVKMGSSKEETVTSLHVDPSGGIIVGGLFRKTVDFDPGPFNYLLSTDSVFGSSYIWKLDAQGYFKWAKQLDSDYPIRIKALGTDGNSLSMFTFKDSIDADPGAGVLQLQAGQYENILLVYLDSSGNFLSGKKLLDISGIKFSGFHVDQAKSLWIWGEFAGTIDMDPGPGQYMITSTGVFANLFLVKYDSAFNIVWAGNIKNDVRPEDVKTDAQLNMYMVGHFTYYNDFNMGAGVYNMTPAGAVSEKDIFVLKMDATGNFVWAHRIGNQFEDAVNGFDLDADANLYFTAKYNGTIDMDPSPAVHNITVGGQHVTKWSKDATYYWSRRYGSSNQNLHAGLSGGIFIPGYYSGNTTFDTVLLVCDGAYDGFLGKLDECPAFNMQIAANGQILSVMASGVSYQWMRCADSSLIPGAGDSTYFAPVNGDYACIVSQSGCSDTTICVSVTGLGTSEPGLQEKLLIYPNPATSGCTLESGAGFRDAGISLYDAYGRTVVERKMVNGHAFTFEIGSLPAGIYIVQVKNATRCHYLKLIKE